jgi:phospholipid/cholesterol/gamma-HCH transport system substrate-binding protein
MYRSLSRRQAVLLALVVLLGLGLGAVGLFAVGGRHWLGNTFQVRAAFADVGGIEVGTRVHVQGLDAGEVEAMDPPAQPGQPVVLHLRVAGKYRSLVGSDASVELAGDGLFGGKVVRILPGQPGAPPVEEGALLQGRAAPELTASLAHAVGRLDRALDQVDAVVSDLRKGEGTVGQLMKSKDAYVEAVKSLQDVRRMVNSVKQNADAIKTLPIVRSYVVDANKELIRPDCKRLRKWFPMAELFEPGRAVLTERGRARLDKAASWLNAHKETGSEVVVAAFADPQLDPDYALTLTQKQSEIVADYLKTQHRIQRMGFWWWSNRRVKALGCGVTPPPVPGNDKLPPARLELLVFVPQT